MDYDNIPYEYNLTVKTQKRRQTHIYEPYQWKERVENEKKNVRVKGFRMKDNFIYSNGFLFPKNIARWLKIRQFT